MRRIPVLIVLAALLAPGAHQLASAQPGPAPEIRTRDYRAGTEMRAGDLGEFLRDNFSIVTGEGITFTEIWLEVEVLSRSQGVVGRSESRRVEVVSGRTYPGSALMRDGRDWTPSLEDWVPSPNARMVLEGRADVESGRGFPRGCEGATHAIRVAVGWEGQAVIDGPLNEGPDRLNIEQ